MHISTQVRNNNCMVSHNESGLKKSVNGDVVLSCEHVRDTTGIHLCFPVVWDFLGISNEKYKDTGKKVMENSTARA